ncbi:MAG: WD40/YVTN/BNR-like repeat-containing protein [Candidatus Aminicenantales bacterium]
MSHPHRFRSSAFILAIAWWTVIVCSLPGEAAIRVDPQLLQGLSWRSIGPAHFSSRASDIAGVPGDPFTYYLAYGSTGLFKTVNGGITFTSVFNDAGTLSIGAVALSPGDPDTIYVGTGEGNLRNCISFGDGIYKSTNGGKTWTNLGLKDSERFTRIVVNPKNPKVVYAAAMGHLWGPNKERGLYRSNDAGATWKQVLYVNEQTGASDVAIDSKDPNIVYCGMYEVLRRPWNLQSGGLGSGLYRSADGGETWTKLTDPKLGNGLPGKKLIGRIGLSVAASNPNVVYAMIESEEPGTLWRSDDRGIRWTMVSDSVRINNRPFYYTTVYCDPTDENRVFALCSGFSVSKDGGRNWDNVGGDTFGDHHTIWIDPLNPKRIINGNDGGFYLSNDGGEKFEALNNMVSAPAYHVGVDTAEPYHVMAGFQDHEMWRGPSEKWNEVGVRGGDWVRLRDMADGMYALADPRDPNIIIYSGHFGDITTLDMRNQEERFIQPYPVGPTGTGAHMDKYRFNWNAPVHISPSNPDVVYYGGNVIFKTTDRGTSWEVISPDLTTNDKTKQQLSGGITPDNTKAEWYCTTLGIAESPLDPKVIWASTDDGNVQLTRDGGKTWTNVSPNIPGLPKLAYVEMVTASPHDAGTAYIAVDQHRLDDFAPYAFATTDFGKTWRPIAEGMKGYVHIVKEDPRTPGLLFAGTELGVYVSFDAGANWTDLRLGIPPVPVPDLVFQAKANDLVIATHARGFYILDDITPLQKLAESIQSGAKAALFQPVPPIRYTPASDTSVLGDRVFTAPNKPYGAIISYYLEAPEQGNKVALEILDGAGAVLCALEGPGAAGVNRVVWDLREDIRRVLEEIKADPGFQVVPTDFVLIRWGRGPKVMPGEYAVRLKSAGQTLESKFTVRLDPRLKVSAEDLKEYESAVRRITKLSMAMQVAMDRIRKTDARLAAAEKDAKASGEKRRIAATRARLAAVRDKLQPPAERPENLNLMAKLNWFTRQIPSFTGRPTNAQIEYIGIFESQFAGVLKELDAIK